MLLRLFFFTLLAEACMGNTHIVNFDANEDSAISLPFTRKWPILHPGSSEIQLNATSAPSKSDILMGICGNLDEWSLAQPELCPHEMWIVLDLDQDKWKRFSKFTLRISWPAYYPTDFTMTIYDPSSLSSYSTGDATSPQSRTRTKYARIQLAHAGVLTPFKNNPLANGFRYDVSFMLKLEPLYFGVLPESVIPIVCSILTAIVLGIPLALRVNNYLQEIAQQARNEIIAKQKAS